MANQIDTDSKVIGGSDIGFGHPAIVRLSNTVMLATHINDSDKLEIHKSIDNGLNWVLKLTTPQDVVNFNLAKISSTSASLALNDGSGNIRYYNSSDSGDTWWIDGVGVLDLLNLGAANADDKVLLVYDDVINRLHLVIAYGGSIYGKYSDNEGDTWTNWTVGRGTPTLYDIDVSPITNYVYFVEDFGDGYVTWHNSVGALVSSFKYGIIGYTSFDHHIAIDSAGNRYLSYIKKSNSTTNEALQIRRNEGSETQLYYLGSPNLIVKGSSSLSIDDDDNVYVFYTKTSDEKTYYRKYDAGLASWGTETLLIADANNRINTEKHILSGSNKLHFVYYKAP